MATQWGTVEVFVVVDAGGTCEAGTSAEAAGNELLAKIVAAQSVTIRSQHDGNDEKGTAKMPASPQATYDRRKAARV